MRNANNPVRVVPDEIGLNQIMRDPLVFGRPTSGGLEDLADEACERGMRDDHE